MYAHVWLISIKFPYVTEDTMTISENASFWQIRCLEKVLFITKLIFSGQLSIKYIETPGKVHGQQEYPWLTEK